MSYCPECGHKMEDRGMTHAVARYYCTSCEVKWVYDGETGGYFCNPDWDEEDSAQEQSPGLI